MAKILTVDDSTTMRQMITIACRGAGFDVDEAPDGQVALAQAKTIQYDLVLSDVNMPNMNGIEFVKALRLLVNYQHTPILMITTESTVEFKAQGRAAGATGWIIKPFDPEQLVSIIRRMLGI